MALAIITADQRLAEAANKTTMAIFGRPKVGKTSLLHTLLPDDTLAVDLEAGMKSAQGWPGKSVKIRTWEDAEDIACLIGGVDPAAIERRISARAMPDADSRRVYLYRGERDLAAASSRQARWARGPASIDAWMATFTSRAQSPNSRQRLPLTDSYNNQRAGATLPPPKRAVRRATSACRLASLVRR